MTAGETASVGVASRRSGRWGAVAGVLQQLMSVAVTVVLARLLEPAEFGLVAIAQSGVAAVSVFANVGLGAALVRRSLLSDVLVSTVCWLSLALGILLSAAAYALAPLMAGALGQPAAADLLRLLSPVIALQVVAAVPRALLQREVRLHLVYALEVVAFVVYAAAQVLLAFAGFGARSVIVGQLAMAVVLLVGLLSITRLRPGWRFSWGSVREDIGFSAQVLSFTFVTYVGKNVDYWVIGRALGAQALGLYYVAFVLPNILRQRISTLMAEIAYPVLARSAGPSELRRTYLRASRLSLFLVLPPMVGLALLSHDIVLLCFGSQWLPAAPAMALLALAAGIEVTVPVTGVIFLALGQPLRAARLQAGRVLLFVLLLALVVRAGATLEAVAGAVLVATLALAVAAHVQVGRVLDAGTAVFVEPLRPVVLPCLLMAGAVLPVRLALADTWAGWPALAFCVPLGATVFVLAGLLLGGPAFRLEVREVRRLVLSST